MSPKEGLQQHTFGASWHCSRPLKSKKGHVLILSRSKHSWQTPSAVLTNILNWSFSSKEEHLKIVFTFFWCNSAQSREGEKKKLKAQKKKKKKATLIEKENGNTRASFQMKAVTPKQWMVTKTSSLKLSHVIEVWSIWWGLKKVTF